MNFDKFMAITSLVIGFSGSILIGKGIFKMSPDLMGKLSSTSWGFSIPALENLAGQKAEFLLWNGSSCVAFAIQFFGTITKSSDFLVFPSYRMV